MYGETWRNVVQYQTQAVYRGFEMAPGALFSLPEVLNVQLASLLIIMVITCCNAFAVCGYHSLFSSRPM